MKKTTINLPEMKLAGITARTNNTREMNADTAQIGATVQKYFYTSIAEKIPHRTKANVTFSVYTEYESDFTGDYTYFIGEQVSSFDGLPQELTSITIPAQQYTKFTPEPGAMPHVVVSAWQQIWHMTPEQLMGTRSYIADFELYDERALDPHNTIVDIYIGIAK